MIGINTGSVFEEFFNQRDSLIVQYENGDMCKSEFLEANFDSVQNSGIQPFEIVDSYEKGMYNYQYYNVLAKYHNMLAKEYKRDKELGQEYKDEADFYYDKKDESSLKLLRCLNFKDVEGYFVETQSRFLNNKLFEVVLNNYDFAILHSKNLSLLETLRENKVFAEAKRKSIIDEYINERY